MSLGTPCSLEQQTALASKTASDFEQEAELWRAEAGSRCTDGHLPEKSRSKTPQLLMLCDALRCFKTLLVTVNCVMN